MKHKARKRFGQNFLKDDHVIDRIVQSIGIQSEDKLVEIGPGQGALTREILPLVNNLEVIELDRDLILGLELLKSSYPGLNIHNADAMRFDFNQLTTSSAPLRVIGNLPYNISTPLIFNLLDHANIIKDMHFMLQKEVVDRIVSNPGDSAYGRLSIMLQYYCRAEYVFTVKPGAFKPAPKVDSAIVRLIPHDKPPVEINDFDEFSKLVNFSFTQRRKTLRNILKGKLDVEQIEALGIEPTIRPERLSLEDFTKIANALSN